ncbi:MAG: hypothetical protein JGK17_15840 [Microcoleus sp. PH2017_10_PVI_O_A]|uniref:hypothetical protein n=1 Tax=unclassified Microcoleus TaxID=2642155 RepID=UPI001D2C095E|nr:MULTISPECIES: hypothetical protein [unclassified Microcoleus]MCC3407032.1 hypothetical protein [Microcoleus sp. PH2017_10_PVI_O_A]MCC3459496.1 hypothetical protein [Microcoleus sp. PH2017_11_PCY_U_A]MCC3477933.1 hypothetical protein [Microcoleus sp. PH2017_12_PCY_D_A]MCC3530309.1 hypothetical protein [Microcoleus sp. PH2017_21_RUC_O_A]MCC3542603.1 hypothetical protein [Microcoleus sp. PH2017_22_RUC_O_B]
MKPQGEKDENSSFSLLSGARVGSFHHKYDRAANPESNTQTRSHKQPLGLKNRLGNSLRCGA